MSMTGQLTLDFSAAPRPVGKSNRRRRGRLSNLNPPVRARDPQSSHDAAARVKPKLSGQLLDVLQAVLDAGPDGASNREIQIAVCEGDNPGHPAWNKVPTRTKTLWDRGYLERLVDPETGEWLLRDHPTSDQAFLVYRTARQ